MFTIRFTHNQNTNNGYFRNIKSKDKPTFEDIGNTTIIPTAVIKNIKKIL